jgi:hypothetical protein
MRKRMKKILALLAISCLASCLLFTSFSFGQEFPKPGEVIDKSNYKKYAHLFPEVGWLAGFEDGWGGLLKPISIKVSETKPGGLPKAFLEISEKNRGKYAIDKDGLISGGYDYLGLPFPGLKTDDKDFGNKLIWNYTYKYRRDDSINPFYGFRRRKGEAVYQFSGVAVYLDCINRLYEPPKPFYKTPIDLQTAMLLHDQNPNDIKDMIYLSLRYTDPRRRDDLYMYIPTLRRVLRGEAGQGSTPIQGAPQASDDYFGFDGKTYEYNYNFIREQKVLACTESATNIADAKKLYKEAGGGVPIPSANWSVRDVYVVEIIPKDPKYPQSKKLVYIDKEGLWILYSFAWDRAGKLWKFFVTTYQKVPLPGDSTMSPQCTISADLQFGMGQTYYMDYNKLTGNGIKYVDVMPSALVKRVK